MIAEDPKSEEIIKPILRGRDIKRYRINWAELWLIATFPSLHLDIENYPAIKRHLLTYGKEKLEQAGKTLPDGSKSRKRTPHAWFELQDTCAYHAEFERDKICYSEIVRQPQFFYHSGSFYVEATGFLMTGKYIKYLCGLLNSKPGEFFFRKYYAGGGLGSETYRYKKAFLNNLPVPAITKSNRELIEQIEESVDKLLIIKSKGLDDIELSSHVNQLVYRLYDLTDGEVKIVENTK